MKDSQYFTELIKKLTDKSTLNKAEKISNNCIRLLNINKENGLVEAEIQGNSIIPYKLNLNLQQNNFYGIINHDCPDYLAYKRPNNKFCKHIIKFFYFLNENDPNLTQDLLNKLYNVKLMYIQNKNVNLVDFNNFVNIDLKHQLDFDYKGFEYFFDILELDDSAKLCLREILKESKKLPAALGGFHGAYDGGLFDHILLVTNYAYNLSKAMNYKVDFKKAILTAIYHDFGKISYYSYKRKDIESKIVVEREELDIVHEEIVSRFNYEGRHFHVEEAIAVLKNNKEVLYFDDEILKAIIFHHGEWSKYYPIDMNELAKLIHKADMIASQTHFV
ncbi:MAG: HD domain-containing protein [Candidatus Thorarchaeota archaeon]